MKFSIQFKTLFSLRAFLSPYARAWNPYFFRFIAGKRHRYAVIDTNQFSILFKSTFAFLRQTLLNGGRFYYFNPYQSNLFSNHLFGLELSQWIPGIFTNKLAMRRIRDLKRMPFFFPSALFLLNLEVKNISFAKEAKSLLIPTIAMMGAYFNHQLIDYPLLSNPSARLATYIIDVSKQMYSSLFINWALEYSFNRKKYIVSKSKLYLPEVDMGYNRYQQGVSVLERASRSKKFNSQEFLSFHFRSFRRFSDRYKRLWNLLLNIKKVQNKLGRKSSKRFGKRIGIAKRKFLNSNETLSSSKKFNRNTKGKYSKSLSNKSKKFIKKRVIR